MINITVILKLTVIKYFIAFYDCMTLLFILSSFNLSMRMLINFLILILILKAITYNYPVKVPNIEWPLLTFKQ